MQVDVKWGNHSFKGDANKVYLEICSIGEEVKPQQMVDFAKSNPESELYKCFTWDNTVAADKWRLQEARQIQCNLMITYRKDERKKTEPITVRASYRTDTNPDAGYRQTVNIVVNKDHYQGMLTVAISELKAFESKYKFLSELKPVWDLIEAL